MRSTIFLNNQGRRLLNLKRWKELMPYLYLSTRNRLTSNKAQHSIKMDNFSKEFITELFLDSDSVLTMNRLVVAVANVVNENNENISMINEAIKKEHRHALESGQVFIGRYPVTRKTKGFYENTVMRYTDKEYVQTFKMKKSTVQALITFLKEHVNFETSTIPLHKKVHIFLWFLTTDSSYNEVGELFDVHKSSVCYVIHEIVSHLCEHRYQFINWPSVEEQHMTRIKVNSKYNFPNCVGFIDACRFKVGSKKYNYTRHDSILLQAVCDETLLFIDIHIGNIGNTKKGKLFKESNLAKELKNFVEFENHILGDSEYRLKKNLITPFTSEEVLTSEEMKFNEVHWKACSYIGRAFELLKERFKKLNHIDINKLETVKDIICAACVLHNFILINEGCVEVKEESVVCDDGVVIDTSIVVTAKEKRQFLCNYINYIESSS